MSGRFDCDPPRQAAPGRPDKLACLHNHPHNNNDGRDDVSPDVRQKHDDGGGGEHVYNSDAGRGPELIERTAGLAALLQDDAVGAVGYCSTLDRTISACRSSCVY